MKSGELDIIMIVVAGFFLLEIMQSQAAAKVAQVSAAGNSTQGILTGVGSIFGAIGNSGLISDIEGD